jgi:hypothetical protein
VDYLGLALNLLGAIVFGTCSQFGLRPRHGSGNAFKSDEWWFANLFGWIFLALGFLVQLIAACPSPSQWRWP